jgi:thiamine biosynthesis lipoprotein ApbE
MPRIALAMLLLLACNIAYSAERLGFHHENVLGTSLELKVNASSEAIAKEAEKQVLAEIDRLALVYSTYDAKSELRQWMDGENSDMSASKELIGLFRLCEEQWTASQGAFDPRVGQVIELWKRAGKDQKLPDESQLAAAVAAAKNQAWRIDDSKQSVRRLAKVPLTFDGIAKGMIVDSACEVALKVPGIEGVMINIGGDLRIAGNFQDEVFIADPKSPAKSLARFLLADKAIATSGNYHRGVKIGEKSFSHIVDPRTGKPVDHVISASVIAETAALADAMATAFNVLPVEQSLELCNSQPQLACMLIDRDGKRHTSLGWPTSDDPLSEAVRSVANNLPKSPSGSKEWISGAELQVDFEINRADDRRYRRPYLAVWLEDKNQAPVRTLALWLQTENQGARWHRDLKRWYKQNGTRKLANGSYLIGTVSAATKPPGMYKAVWDGKDDNGKLVKQGKYTLFVEAVREHGTYQLTSKEVLIGDESQKGDLNKNAEIKSVHFEYIPRGSSK